MATEKVLNTRIQLKYDTLANWEASSFKLKAGEIAIATLGNVKDGSSAGDVNQHPVLFKVGDGVHTFAELPYASALAADVYAWAKKSEGEFANSFLSLVGTDGQTIQAKLNAIFATDTELANAIAALKTELTGNDGIAGLAARIKALEDDRVTEEELAAAVKAEADRAKGVEAELDAAIKAIDFVDEDELATALAPYAKSADVANTYETIANADLIRGRVADLEAHKDDYKAYADQAELDAIAAAKTETQNQVKALSDSIKDHATVDSFADVMTEMAKYQIAGDYATKAEAQGYANAKDEAIAAAKASGDKAQEDLGAYQTANDAAVALKANVADLEAEIARAKAAEKANSDAIALLVDSTTGDDTKMNSIKELATWIEEHGGDAAEMAEAISDNAEAIAAEVKRAGDEEVRLAGLITAEENRAKGEEARVEGLVTAEANRAKGEEARIEGLVTAEAGRADTEEKRLAGLIADNAAAISALNAADGKVANAGHADSASELDAAGVEQVKGIKVNNAVNADEAAHAVNADKAVDADKLGGVVAANYALKTDAQGYANTAESNAKTAAQGYANTAETNAKGYADSLASNYATAAQGAKADSALQSVEVGTGLKVSEKANNKQTIEIDTDVVFVFNCGSASTLID